MPPSIDPQFLGRPFDVSAAAANPAAVDGAISLDGMGHKPAIKSASGTLKPDDGVN